MLGPFDSIRFAHIENLDDVWPHAEVIQVFGIDTEFGSALVDDQYWVEGEAVASGHIFVIPRLAEPLPPGETALIANCLTFITEVPTLPLGRLDARPPTPTWPVERVPPEGPAAAHYHHVDPGERFADSLGDSIEPVTTSRWGPYLLSVLPWDVAFDWPQADVASGGYPVAAVKLASWAPAEECLALYAASVRQVDPFSEYVLLYRVIENVSNSNGRDWIEEALSTLSTRPIGEIWVLPHEPVGKLVVPDQLKPFVDEDRLQAPSGRGRGSGGRKLIDLAELIRALALARESQLSSDMSHAEIAGRLYSDLRCGIAHAHADREFLRHDVVDDLVEVLADLPLLRYLGRAAIVELAPDANSIP